MFDFFLAHGGRDAAVARELYDALQPAACALDAVTVGPGLLWQDGLVAAQRESRVSVVMVSPRVPDAWYFQEEVARAIDLARTADHRVMRVDLPGTTKDHVPYGLFRVQAVRWTSAAQVADELRGALAGAPSVPLPVALVPVVDDARLYDAAVAAWKSNALDEIIRMRLRAPFEDFRHETGSKLAMDLVHWAGEQEPAVRDELVRLLRQKVPNRFR